MMRRSALEELAARGIDADAATHLPAMSSLGYREIGTVVRGQITLDEALTRIKHETRRFMRAGYVVPLQESIWNHHAPLRSWQ